MRKLSDKGKNVIEVFLMLLSIITAWIFWDTFVIFPVKLFVVLLHEISHLLTAVFSGGTVKELEIDYHIGGSCVLQGGNQWLTALTGYLGSMLFGSLMFLSANNIRLCKTVCIIISLIFIIITIMYIKILFGILFTLGFAVILFLLVLIPFDYFRRLFIKILGMLSCLYILFDVKNDLLTFEYKDSDALVLEKATTIPSIYWGILIFIITFITIYYLFKFNFKSYVVKEIEETEEIEEE